MRSVFFVGCLLAASSAFSQGVELCGEIDDGARDYRRMTRAERRHIEGAHFTRDVERLRRGKTGLVGGDIDYTLRHMPNHPAALSAMMRLGERLKRETVPGAQYPVGCYFQRAVRFAPDDAQAQFGLGLYLLKRGERDAARSRFDEAARLVQDQPNLDYNLGLVFLELGDVDAARRHAERAYGAGPQPPGLAKKLEQHPAPK